MGCRAYWTLRTGFGVAFRFSDPLVLRTGCSARLTGLGSSPRRKLIGTPRSTIRLLRELSYHSQRHPLLLVQTIVFPLPSVPVMPWSAFEQYSPA